MIATVALAAALAAGAAAEEPVNNINPEKSIAAAVRHAAPKGWKKTSYANGSDPVLRYAELSDEIIVKVFGGAGSAYAKPADFMAGPGATQEGEPPASAGKAKVAGRDVALLRRSFPLQPHDPHGSNAPSAPRGRETFCVVPLAGQRFAVLAWRRASPVPDLQGRGEKAWSAFLKSVKPAAPVKK